MQSQQDENLTLIEDFAQIFPLEERILRAQREGHSLLVASYCEVNGASANLATMMAQESLDFLSSKRFINLVASKLVSKATENIPTKVDQWVTNRCYENLNPNTEIPGSSLPLPSRDELHRMIYEPTELETAEMVQMIREPIPLSSGSQSESTQERLLENMQRMNISADPELISGLSSSEAEEINQQLMQINAELPELFATNEAILHHMDAARQTEDISRLSRQLCLLGERLNIIPLSVFGSIIQFTSNVYSLPSFEAFVGSFATKGLSALINPASLVLDCISILAGLFGKNETSQEIKALGQISKQIHDLSYQISEMHQAIGDGFLGLGKLQIKHFNILKNCLLDLKADLGDKILGMVVDSQENFELLDSKLSYIANLQYSFSYNNYIQSLNHLIASSQHIELNQFSKAKLITDGFEIWLKTELKNRILNGYIIKEAQPPIEQEIDLLNQCLQRDENSDKRLSCLLGFYLNDQEIYNLVLFNHVTTQYLNLNQKFFFLYSQRHRSHINQLIEEIDVQRERIFRNDDESWELYLSAYHDALNEVRIAQKACIQAHQANRFNIYNQDYKRNIFVNDFTLTTTDFDLTKSITDFIEIFVNACIQHCNTDSLNFQLINDSNLPGEKNPYTRETVKTHRVFHSLKESSLEIRENLKFLWCLEFFKQANFILSMPLHIIDQNKISELSDGCLMYLNNEDMPMFHKVKYSLSISANQKLSLSRDDLLDNTREHRPLKQGKLDHPMVFKIQLQNGEDKVIDLEYITFAEGLEVKDAQDDMAIRQGLSHHLKEIFNDHTIRMTAIKIETNIPSSYQENLNRIWQQERQLLLDKLLKQFSLVHENKEAELFICYKKSLQKLDYAVNQLKLYAHLNRHQLSDEREYLTSDKIREELYNSLGEVNEEWVTNPSLVNIPEITKEDFVEFREISPSHPWSLLRDTQRKLILAKYWFEMMEFRYPLMFSPISKSHLALNTFHFLEDFRQESFTQNMELLAQSFAEQILKLDYKIFLKDLDSKNYYEIYQSIISLVHQQSKLPSLTGILSNPRQPIDKVKLSRSWEMNFGFLMQKAQQIFRQLGLPSIFIRTIDFSQLKNYKMFYIGCSSFIKLIHHEKAKDFAYAENMFDAQYQFIKHLVLEGESYNNLINEIALSHQFFSYLFDQYISPLQDFLAPEIIGSDEEIFSSLVHEQGHPLHELYLQKKSALFENFLVLKNYIELAFNQRFSYLISKFKNISLVEIDAFDDYLNPKDKTNTLRERIDVYRAEIENFKEMFLNYIHYQQNLKVFAEYLESQKYAPNLVIEPQVLGLVTTSFDETFIEILDQYLSFNSQLDALTICNLPLDDTLMTSLVTCIKKHRNIQYLGLISVDLKAQDLIYLAELFPQLRCLNLQKNHLGEQGHDALVLLMNFVRQTFYFKSFEFLDLTHNHLDEAAKVMIDIAREQAIEIIPEDGICPQEETNVSRDEKMCLKLPASYGQTALVEILNILKFEESNMHEQIIRLSSKERSYLRFFPSSFSTLAQNKESLRCIIS